MSEEKVKKPSGGSLMDTPRPAWGHMYVKKPSSEGGNYSYKEKVNAAATYIATGNWMATSKITGITRQTLYVWKNSTWWPQLLLDLQVQDKLETNNTLRKLRDKALNVVMDRLENGNCQFDQKSGTVRRIPVNARDAHKIAVDLIDKEDLLRERVKRLGSLEEEKTKDTLKQLADAFTQMAKTQEKKEKEKVIEVVDVELVEDEN